MAFDSKIRKLWAILTIPAVLRAIGAGYERGGLSGLRDLATDMLASVGLYSKAPQVSTLPAATGTAAALTPDEVFWLSIKDSRAPGLFEEFLKKYPDSPRAAAARVRLQALQAAAGDTGKRQPTQMPMHGPGMMTSPGRGG
jgi:hypothetical protein